MRIVAGQWRGRRISAPRGQDVRPTLDRVREAWMSILQSSISGSRVLDLFAGSGALGLEALSRGARAVDFVEKDPRAFGVLQSNVELLGAQSMTRLHKADALRFASRAASLAYDIAFADPPYASDAASALATLWLERPFATILSIEHSSRETLPGEPDLRQYGDTALAFYYHDA